MKKIAVCVVVVLLCCIIAAAVIALTIGEVMLIQYLGWNAPTQVFGILFAVNILLLATVVGSFLDL